MFFVLEAKFVTHGILAAGGVLSMVLGALMLINTRLPGASVTLATALSVALPFALITVFLLRLVIRARQAKVSTGEAGMVGELGRAETPLDPEGKVLVHGELWQAVSSEPVPPGSWVRVKSLDGMTMHVEPVSRPQPAATAPGPQPQSEPRESAKGA